jgi:hypothetical protein
MEKRQLASTAGGLLVILLGILILVDRILPVHIGLFSWPLIVLGVGAAFFLGGFGTRALGLVIPGTIIAGIGGILLWQNSTGRWFSWAYVWTLIPGFVGLGLLVFSWLDPAARAMPGVRLAVRWLLAISAFLFLVFTTFLGPFRWFWALLGLGLIAAGGVLVTRGLAAGRTPKS